MAANERPRILLTGASGYIGGRLLSALKEQGYPVRCLARRPEFLRSRAGPRTEVVPGDVLDSESILSAMNNVAVAFYLIHSMGVAGCFEEEDRRGAANFAAAAKAAGVERIIYLGGLGEGDNLSTHLVSRHEVGRILRESGIPTIEFRASIIIGSGSLSFEMIRALVTKLPVMVTPRWVRVLSQPIAIEDVIDYLMAAIQFPLRGSAIYEIGGTDRVSYLDLMLEFARQRGLKRLVIPVPVLTPWLSSLWLGLVTPVYARVGRKLIDSVKNETVVRDDQALRDFPIRPRGYQDAITRALRNEDREYAATRWSDALSSMGSLQSYGGIRLGSRLIDSRTLDLDCPPEAAFAPVRRIGGETGWYYGNTLWRLRGFLDLLCGGAGLRRGRRDPEFILPGDTIDFWRVEACEPDRLLRLIAEMKVPGRAWLQFEVESKDRGSVIRQTAIFDPAGILGLLYWYSLYPFHGLVFGGMLREIGKEAMKQFNDHRKGDRS